MHTGFLREYGSSAVAGNERDFFNRNYPHHKFHGRDVVQYANVQYAGRIFNVDTVIVLLVRIHNGRVL